MVELCDRILYNSENNWSTTTCNNVNESQGLKVKQKKSYCIKGHSMRFHL